MKELRNKKWLIFAYIHTKRPQQADPEADRKWIGGRRQLGEEGQGAWWVKGSFLGHESVLELNSGMAVQHYERTLK